jgi:hypothetical protein
VRKAVEALLATALALACAQRAAAPDASVPAAADPPVISSEAGEDGPCQADSDCVLTRVEMSGCCTTLCYPRAVIRRRAQELEASAGSCSARCDKPQCAPLKADLEAVCVAGRCRARPVPPPSPLRKPD